MRQPGFVITTFCLFLAQAGFGQDVPDKTPQTGLLPSNTYTIDNLETIDRVNGNVIYQIPLASLPKVGASDPFQLKLTYNSQNLLAFYSYVSDPNQPGQYLEKANLGGGGQWVYNTNYFLFEDFRPVPPNGSPNCPDQTSYKTYRMRLVTPDGNQRILNLYGYSDAGGDGFYSVDPGRGVNFNCNGGSTPISGPLTYFTNDGSYIRVVVNLPGNQYGFNWTAYFPDGTTTADSWSGPSTHTTTITDRNKNTTTIETTSTGTVISNAAGSITIQSNSISPTTSTDTITTAGFGGSKLTWTVNYQQFAFSGPTGYYICDSLGDQCPASLGGNLATSINLPSPTGVPLVFQFGYNTNNGWGNLNLVRYPSGAAVKFQYLRDGSTIGIGPFFLTNPVVRKELDYADVQDGSSTPRTQVWTFAYQVNNAFCNSMTAPDNGVDTVCFTQLRPTSEALTGTVYKRTTATGQMDEKEFLFNRPAWDDTRAPNPYVAMEVKTAAGTTPQAAVTSHTIDVNGNDLQTNEYDFVPYSSISHGPTGQPSGSPTGQLLRNTAEAYTVVAPVASNNQSTPDSASGYWSPGASPLQHLLARSVTAGAGPGAAEEYSYDANGNVLETRRWDSTKSSASPGALNAGNALVEDYTYNSRGNPTSKTDGRRIQTVYIYDTTGSFLLGETLASQTPQAESIGFGRDTYTGLLTSRTDANSVTTYYGYDSLGRLTSKREAAGQTVERDTSISYEDANLRVVTCSDQNRTGDFALVSVVDYDPLGRVRLNRQMETASCSSPDDDTAGIKVQTRYLYSGNNSYQLVSNPFRETTSSTASAACNGNFPSCTMGWTLTTFDQDGRTLAQQTFDGSGLPAPWGGNKNGTGTTATAYNAQTTTVTDQSGHVRVNSVDGLSRLTQVQEDPGGAPHLSYLTTYTYDVLDNLASVNQSGRTRGFAYDSLKRLSQAVNPETGTVTYGYDADGDLTSKSDARGASVSYTYDALNRMTGKTYAGIGGQVAATPNVNYVYDPGIPFGKERLASVTANGVSATNYLAYDALGRVLQSNQQTEGQTYPFSYSYNLAGSVTSENYPSSRVVNTAYDGANRPNGVTQSLNGVPGIYASGVTYAPQGAFAALTYGNGAVLSFAYENRLRPLFLTTNSHDPGGPTYLQFNYAWNADSTLAAYSENIGGPKYSGLYTLFQKFSYDGVARLTSATEQAPSTAVNWSRNFSYDAYGNMWEGWSTNPAVPFTGDTPTGNNYSAKNQRIDRSYDSAGNQIGVSGDTALYDAENRQAVITESGVNETYLYDGNGNRVEKISPAAAKTVYVYDTFGQLSAEYSTNPSTAPCSTCYLSWDHLGTPRLVTDQTGKVIARHAYLPFGEELTASTPGRNSDWGPGNDNIPQKFTGKERDGETGLDYFGARYFGSALGRFMSPDPENASGLNHLEDPQSWNAYSYVRNNPLKYTDPNGEDYQVCDADGKNCSSFDDKTWANFRDANGIQQAGNGDLSVTNQNGSETKIGSAQYYDPRAGNAVAFLNFSIGALASNYLFGAGEAGLGVAGQGLAASRLAGSAVQGANAASTAGRVVKVIEEAGGVVHLEITSGGRTYEVVANIERDGGRIVLDGAHIEGSGSGQFGGGMLREIREAARQFAQERGATEVTINPGIRTSGANPGRAMGSFTVRVE